MQVRRYKGDLDCFGSYKTRMVTKSGLGIHATYRPTYIHIWESLSNILLGLLPPSSLMSSAPQPMSLTELNARLKAMLAQELAVELQLPSSSSDRPTPSLGSASPKVVPPHPLSPPVAPSAKRQKSGTPRAPSADPCIKESQEGNGILSHFGSP